MRALVAALLAALLALPLRAEAQEQPTEAPSAEAAAEGSAAPVEPWPAPPQPPVYETWWFWTAIAAVVVGVTLAIVVGLTTEHPRSSRAGLVLAF